MEKAELKKYVGAVHISNHLTVIQRKAFSVLLYNAYHDLGQGKKHEISVRSFCDLLGYKSRDYKRLEAEIKKLQVTFIHSIEEDGINNLTFFSSTKLGTGESKGKFFYRFDPDLEKILYHPDIYAQINLLSIRQFKGRYAIALYENLARYKPNRSFKGGSPQWTLDQFRELMGVAEIPSYQQFKELKRNIIAPAVKEINAVSDITVELVTVKTGRAITAIKFDVSLNKQPSLGLIPAPDTIETEAKHPLAKQMHDLYSVPPMQAGEWLLQYGEDRFKQVLDLINESILTNDIKSPIAWIRKAFEDNYTHVTGNSVKEKILAQKKEEERQRKKEKIKITQEKKRAALEQEQSEEKAMADYLNSLTPEQKTELFNQFYDEHNDLLTKGLPINRGDDPSISDNEQVLLWWRNFMRESLV